MKDLSAAARRETDPEAVQGSSGLDIEIRSASVSADDPWMFFPAGLDWTWISIGRARTLVRDARRELAKAQTEVPLRWSYQPREDPGTPILDLALQSLPARRIRAVAPSAVAQSASAPRARGSNQGLEGRSLDDPGAESDGLEDPNHSDPGADPGDVTSSTAQLASVEVEVPLTDPDAVTSGWPWSHKADSQVSRFTLKAEDDGEVDLPGSPDHELFLLGDPGDQETWGPVGIRELERATLRHPAGSGREVIVFSASLERLVDRLAFTWMMAVGAAAAVVRESELAAANAWAHPSAMWLGPDAEERLLKLLEFAGGSSLRAQRRLMSRTERVFLVGGPQSSALRALSRDLSFQLIEVSI